MKALTKVILFCFIVLILACSEEENNSVQPPPQTLNPTLTGNWFGSDTSHPSTLTVLLSELNTIVSGSGTQSGFNGTPAFNVTGVNIYPDISLSIFRTGEEDMNYTGTFTSANIIVGMWIRPSSSIPITFVRQ